MLTLLGALTGFLAPFLPDLLSIFRDRQDKAHELKILELQMRQQAAGHAQRLDEVEIRAEGQRLVKVYEHAKRQPTGVRWVDALLELAAGLVRPGITYAFFALYAAVKYAQYEIAVLYGADPGQTLDWTAALLRVWNAEDQAIFSTIIAFWFGQRFRNRVNGVRER